MNVLVVRAVATAEVIDWFAMVPEPVLLSKTTVFESAVQVAVSVTFALTDPDVGYVTPAA